MLPLTLEWMSKAEGDWASAQRELRARRAPNYDSACFHAQQCAEKYLKARLQQEGIAFTRTHDLVVLLDLLLPIEPSWVQLRPRLRALTVAAVDYRYPGASATKATAREAVVACRDLRAVVRTSLGLP